MKEKHIIAAVCDGRGIGYDNKLIMRIPADMQHFKDLTLGNVVIMGRNTYESLGSTPLKCRNNIVVTKSRLFDTDKENLWCVTSLEDAFELAENIDGDKIFVIGGGQLYEAAMPNVDILDITEINFNPNNVDTYFPEIDVKEWLPVKRSERYFTEKIPLYRFVTYKRKN